VDKGLNFPNGITLTPDQSQLLVADMRGAGIYAFHIKPDGSLANKQLYFFAHIPVTRTDSGADGLAVDSEGRLYAATHTGIQVFDQAGRVNAIISGPVPGRRPSNLAFGGPGHNYLYITHGDKVYRRKTRAGGVLLFNQPMLPPTPRL
jgi:sugar lactone lactonase YvrE